MLLLKHGRIEIVTRILEQRTTHSDH
nr:Ycf15 protein [Swertia dilatata]QWW91147.1 Ycf15 protein [Swertia dilatata]